MRRGAIFLALFLAVGMAPDSLVAENSPPPGAEQKIIIKAPTLNRYLSEYQAGREKEAVAESAAPEPPANKTQPYNGGKTMSAMITEIGRAHV